MEALPESQPTLSNELCIRKKNGIVPERNLSCEYYRKKEIQQTSILIGNITKRLWNPGKETKQEPKSDKEKGISKWIPSENRLKLQQCSQEATLELLIYIWQ